MVIRWEQLERKNQKFGLLPQNYEEALEQLLLQVKSNKLLQASNEDLQAKGTYEFEARYKTEKELKLLKKQIAMQEDKDEIIKMYRS